MTDCYAVLLDTVSIQNFIFSSNKLRENLGASYLVEELYRRYLACALSKIIGGAFEEELETLDSWKTAKSETPDCSKPVDIGYIGGGNALLFFQNEDLVHKFIEEWTKILLLRAPGIITAVAFGPFPKEPEKFRESLSTFFEKLEQNKAKHAPITMLPRHGITTECRRSGVSAEFYNERVKEYVSAGTNARIEAADISKNTLENEFKELLNDQYSFSNELDELGGIRGEDSHIAIVHIDGNEIGKRFKNAQSLKAIRELSKDIDDTTRLAFKTIIKTIAEDENYTKIMKSLGFDPGSNDPQRQYPTDEKYKKILPIRPIILGGDDVTFVCDGKLGIYFAKIFIEAFEKGKINDSGRLTACAGIAIIKTKYPFYRGVTLANELCKKAKRIRKDPVRGDLNSSFLDFHISLGGVAGSLETIRQRDYENRPQGSLLYRPFKIVPKEPFDEFGLDLFLEKAWQLQYASDRNVNLPNHKINELNEVLTLPEEVGRKFVQELKFRGRKLPAIKGHQYEETLFENQVTPYFDMIEILRFYPDFALQENGAKP